MRNRIGRSSFDRSTASRTPRRKPFAGLSTRSWRRLPRRTMRRSPRLLRRQASPASRRRRRRVGSSHRRRPAGRARRAHVFGAKSPPRCRRMSSRDPDAIADASDASRCLVVPHRHEAIPDRSKAAIVISPWSLRPPKNHTHPHGGRRITRLGIAPSARKPTSRRRLAVSWRSPGGSSREAVTHRQPLARPVRTRRAPKITRECPTRARPSHAG